MQNKNKGFVSVQRDAQILAVKKYQPENCVENKNLHVTSFHTKKNNKYYDNLWILADKKKDICLAYDYQTDLICIQLRQ